MRNLVKRIKEDNLSLVLTFAAVIFLNGTFVLAGILAWSA